MFHLSWDKAVGVWWKFPKFVCMHLSYNDMKRFILVLLAVAAVSVGADAKSRVVTDSLFSNILGCNRAYSVCVPDGYSKDDDRSYPVLYLLHGSGSDNLAWVKKGHVDEVMDYLTASGMCDQMVIVMPSADDDIEKARRGYFNCPQWRYEDYFFQELMPHVEGRYRIKAEKGYRAIAGLSMGGGGAVSYAQKHPELFCVCYAMSAFVRVCKTRPITDDMDDKVNLMRISARENDCVTFVENASDEVKSRLKTVDWFIDCGDDDHLFEVNVEFVLQMKEAGIPFEFRVREGGHKWEYWRTALHICLPYISRKFGE